MSGQIPPQITCGKRGHKHYMCHFKDATCHFCGKVGHLKSVCLYRKNGLPSKQGKDISAWVC